MLPKCLPVVTILQIVVESLDITMQPPMGHTGGKLAQKVSSVDGLSESDWY
jgi:hypothetical protein